HTQSESNFANNVQATSIQVLSPDLIVDTLADENDGDYSSGDLSLREAIDLANRRPGADTITFIAPSSGTIHLTLGELPITDSVTITGPGANLVTIDASDKDLTPLQKNGDGIRLFNIDDGNPSTFQDVTISGLKLTGGDSNANGGAIFTAEDLTVS